MLLSFRKVEILNLLSKNYHWLLCQEIFLEMCSYHLRNWLRYWLRWCFSFICFLWLIVFRNGLTYVRNTRDVILSFYWKSISFWISTTWYFIRSNFHFQEKLKLSKEGPFYLTTKIVCPMCFWQKKLQINWTLYW